MVFKFLKVPDFKKSKKQGFLKRVNPRFLVKNKGGAAKNCKKLQKIDVFFAKIHAFFVKIGKNYTSFDTFLATFRTFWAKIGKKTDQKHQTQDNRQNWLAGNA